MYEVSTWSLLSDAIDALGMVAKAGYWRVPNTTRFIACLNPVLALELSMKVLLARERVLNDAEEGCDVDKGFEAGWCSRQLSPWVQRDGAAGCKPCYKGELKLFFPILVALLILLLLLFFIWSTVIKRVVPPEIRRCERYSYLFFNWSC